MDERNLAQRRKSGLVVSISMENPIVDEFETEWPKLARTEIIAKMARNTSTNNIVWALAQEKPQTKTRPLTVLGLIQLLYHAKRRSATMILSRFYPPCDSPAIFAVQYSRNIGAMKNGEIISEATYGDDCFRANYDLKKTNSAFWMYGFFIGCSLP